MKTRIRFRCRRPHRTPNDDDDAAVEDTGPDPEEAEKRFTKIERTFNRAMTCIGKDDVKGYERNMSRAVSDLMEIKLLPLFIDKLSPT